jgi:hypothetical protein
MKLFTKDIDEKLFKQYLQGSNLESQNVVAKIFNPYGMGTWYLLNSDPDDPDYLYVISDLNEIEIGSVSRNELESVKVQPFGLGLERDLYFESINAKELFDGLLRGEQFGMGGKVKQRKDTVEFEDEVDFIEDNQLIEVDDEVIEDTIDRTVIPNNYAGKTPAQVWNGWLMAQRKHFITDHMSRFLHEDDIEELWEHYKGDFDQLPERGKEEIERHVMQGQYAKGGSVDASLPENKIVAFHIGSGGRFNNSGHKSFLGFHLISDYKDELYPSFENLPALAKKFTPAKFEKLQYILERENYSDLRKIGVSKKELGDACWNDSNGSFIITDADMQSGIGTIDIDGEYDTTYTKYLEDCDLQELELIRDHEGYCRGYDDAEEYILAQIEEIEGY